MYAIFGPMTVDQRLVDAAIDQMNRRWPADEQAGAAALSLDNGEIITSVCLDNINAGVVLCHEAGAMCQAHTLDRRVVGSVCVGRDEGSSKIHIYAPCGICQERLALWGPDVHVGVADASAALGWSSKTLREVNPYYWATKFGDDGSWPKYEVHTT